MKAKIEIDASPEEWRRFFGLPDVSGLHAEMMDQAREKIASGDYDPLNVMKQFVPENFQKMAEMQQAFWESLFKPGSSTEKE